MAEGPPHLLVLDARFYEDVADDLVRGALAELDRTGATHQRVSVPGVFELPAAIRLAIANMEAPDGASHSNYDGFVALGCVIQGETEHFQHIGREGIRGLNDLALQYAVAIGNGILTCATKQQALERADPDKTNVGGRAARTAVEMAKLKHSLLSQR